MSVQHNVSQLFGKKKQFAKLESSPSSEGVSHPRGAQASEVNLHSHECVPDSSPRAQFLHSSPAVDGSSCSNDLGHCQLHSYDGSDNEPREGSALGPWFDHGWFPEDEESFKGSPDSSNV
jgi:hypothetical protein